jgi:hypothetical protein
MLLGCMAALHSCISPVLVTVSMCHRGRACCRRLSISNTSHAVASAGVFLSAVTAECCPLCFHSSCLFPRCPPPPRHQVLGRSEFTQLLRWRMAFLLLLCFHSSCLFPRCPPSPAPGAGLQ